MPAKSKAQFRYMQGVAHGSIKGKGLSRAAAAEYVAGQSPKNLPEKKTMINYAKRRKPTTKAAMVKAEKKETPAQEDRESAAQQKLEQRLGIEKHGGKK